MIAFFNTDSPCVDNEITRWHLRHGWLYNAYRIPARKPVGVFFATLLCGDGAVVHFDVIPEARLSPLEILHGFRKGIRMMLSAQLNVIYATIPEEYGDLIRVASHLGFRIVRDGGFRRDEKHVALLRLDPEIFDRRKKYSKDEKPKENSMSTSPAKAKPPADPDPTPRAASDSSEAVAQADRQERKRAASQYGRQQTILAGNTAANNTSENKKTVLGG